MMAALVLATMAAVSAVMGEPVRVPGTHIALVPPEGFVAAQNFPGFQRADLQASIMVSELPAPISEVKAGMTRAGLASRDMTLVSSTTEKVSGGEALLVAASQTAQGVQYAKWMLMMGDEKATAMVVGTCPKSSQEKVEKSIRAALLSITWTSAGPLDPFEGLKFRVTASAKLPIAGRMADMLMLSESGQMVAKGPDDGLLIVGHSISPVPVTDLRAYSETNAGQTAELTSIGNFRCLSVEVAGLDGLELLADAKDKKSDVPMLLYQVIAPDGDGYVIIVGLISAKRAEELLPEFRRVTQSFEMAKSSGAEPAQHK